MKKNGFTLIELVAVVVILGILALTAAPRFLNLQTDARNAALEGLKGAVESGLAIGYSKLAMAGLESLPYVSNRTPYDPTPVQSLPLPGCEELYEVSKKECTFLYGYPDSEEYTLPRLVQNLEGDSDCNAAYRYRRKNALGQNHLQRQCRRQRKVSDAG